MNTQYGAETQFPIEGKKVIAMCYEAKYRQYNMTVKMKHDIKNRLHTIGTRGGLGREW
jgi:hypothetical protein